MSDSLDRVIEVIKATDLDCAELRPDSLRDLAPS